MEESRPREWLVICDLWLEWREGKEKQILSDRVGAFGCARGSQDDVDWNGTGPSRTLRVKQKAAWAEPFDTQGKHRRGYHGIGEGVKYFAGNGQNWGFNGHSWKLNGEGGWGD